MARSDPVETPTTLTIYVPPLVERRAIYHNLICFCVVADVQKRTWSILSRPFRGWQANYQPRQNRPNTYKIWLSSKYHKVITFLILTVAILTRFHASRDGVILGFKTWPWHASFAEEITFCSCLLLKQDHVLQNLPEEKWASVKANGREWEWDTKEITPKNIYLASKVSTPYFLFVLKSFKSWSMHHFQNTKQNN